MTTVFIFCGVLTILLLGLLLYFYRNLNQHKWRKKKIYRAGFRQKQVSLPNGMVLNYGEGPQMSEPLLLIHGQGGDWMSYAKVLPELAKHFHIYAVDCPGHGRSGIISDGYTAEKIGADLTWFIEHVVGKPVFISGHSSGGLLAVWLAAHAMENVKGLVLEDPPLFSTEKGRYHKTYAWLDSFRLIHEFYHQEQETDYLIFYLKNSYWKDKFGKLWDLIIKRAVAFRKKNPKGIFREFYLPPSLNRIWAGASNDHYDKQFGEAFYDASWLINFHLARTLPAILCPSILIYAKQNKWPQYDQDGVLLGAMTDQDAQRARALIPGNVLLTVDSGHDVHEEQPEKFVEAVTMLLKNGLFDRK